MQGTPSIKEECLLNEDKEKIKTLFPYVGKKPLRIGKEVAETFKQSGCSLFVDLFCGSIAMLCYLPWNTAVAYYYVSFGDYRGRVDNAPFQFSACEDTNRADTYQKNMKWMLALSKRLQNVVILNRDFREVLKSYNKEHVFVYADCPYLGTEYYYDHAF